MAMTYEETMAWGAAQYADVTAALTGAGLRAEFVQTGGMCPAIIVPLDAGHYLLLVDRDDVLSWRRDDHVGWWVGLSEPDERRTVDGPLRWLESDDGSPEEAVRLARAVIRGEGER